MKQISLRILLLLMGILTVTCLPVSVITADEWFNKGNSLDKLGKYEEASEAFDQALKIDPEFRTAWFDKEDSLDKLGKNEEASEAFDQAIKIDPENKWAWYNKGNS